MARNLNFNDFPKLVINSDDVGGSWKNWLNEFDLSVEMITLRLGEEKVRIDGEEETVDVFRGRMKLVSLLNAVGKAGRAALTSLGFDQKSATSTYEGAMELLKTVYESEETVYVKTMKFVTASQAIGENENDYLLRIEDLSRKMTFGTEHDALRQEFALAIAVNGLRESSLRSQLMQQNDLNWTKFSGILRAKKIARDSERTMETVKAGNFNVKLEVDAVENKSEDKDSQFKFDSDSDNEKEMNRVSSRDKHKSRGYGKDRKSSKYDKDYSKVRSS